MSVGDHEVRCLIVEGDHVQTKIVISDGSCGAFDHASHVSQLLSDTCSYNLHVHVPCACMILE